MKLRNLEQIRTLEGKRVLLRLDLNVPLKGDQVDPSGDWRLDRSLPTINYLIKHKAKIIIVAHLGRPDGQRQEKFSLLPVAKSLSKKLGQKIEFWADDFRDYVKDSQSMEFSQIAMLENIRFEPREKKNCKRLAKDLSKLADIYVNDAFGNLHRQDSSMHAITEYLPAYAGFLIIDEIKHLSQILDAKDGVVIMFGGAKISTKIKLIKKLSVKADKILLGGALANTMIKASGYSVGKSLVDDKSLASAKTLLKNNIHLPIDVNVATSLKVKKYQTKTIDNIPKNAMILDIGPATIKEYESILKSAKLVVWNGPFGYFENKNFVQGSREIMKYLAKLPAKVIIGGGETVELAKELGFDKKFDFISTGGGAMLTYLGGSKMPSLDRLKIR
ncbi:phosphoglycerate kinase [Patescibacteria group bacterium]|nr:phosphoglycerate kinase [Patescibacteria group bacterium]